MTDTETKSIWDRAMRGSLTPRVAALLLADDVPTLKLYEQVINEKRKAFRVH